MKHQATGVIQGVRGEHLREALGSDPSSLAFVGLAHISYQDGDHEGAISICREGLNYHPNHSTAHLILGLALAGAGNKRESIRALQEVIKLDPGNRLANRHLGEMRRKKPDKIPEQVTPMPLPDEEPEETHIGDEIAFFTFSMAYSPVRLTNEWTARP